MESLLGRYYEGWPSVPTIVPCRAAPGMPHLGGRPVQDAHLHRTVAAHPGRVDACGLGAAVRPLRHSPKADVRATEEVEELIRPVNSKGQGQGHHRDLAHPDGEAAERSLRRWRSLTPSPWSAARLRPVLSYAYDLDYHLRRYPCSGSPTASAS